MSLKARIESLPTEILRAVVDLLLLWGSKICLVSVTVERSVPGGPLSQGRVPVCAGRIRGTQKLLEVRCSPLCCNPSVYL